MTELIRLTAREAVARLEAGEVTPLDLLDAAIARIEQVEPDINALPITCFDRARDRAKRLMADGAPRGPGRLAGLPIAIKDLMDVEGVRTTYGCPLFKDNVAAASDVLVRRLESRGGVVAAKSNTPEFGMLPVTDNRVFGPTRNPWNTDLSPGGSSGGAAAAVASGEIWLAHGSDIGGSLRIPAGFTGVCGHRPSIGLVPRNHSRRNFSPMAVQGPMARTVGDIALFLDAMTGFDPVDPWSLPDRPETFVDAVDRATAPKRVGFAGDIGVAPCEPEVLEIVEAAARKLERLGTTIDAARPDFTDISNCYRVMIGMNALSEREQFVMDNRDAVEPVLRAVIEGALRLTPQEIAAAERTRAASYASCTAFFKTYDLWLLPTLSCPAFPASLRGVDMVDGWAQLLPPAWFQQCWGTVLTTCPALSIPAGFTKAGLPVGIQIIGPPRADAAVLAAGAVLEAELALETKFPIDPRGPAPL
jgi:amidase